MSNQRLLLDYVEKGDPQDEGIENMENFDDEDIDPDYSKEKKVLDSLLQNQNYFYIMMRKVSEIVRIREEEIESFGFCQVPAESQVVEIAGDSQFNFFN